MSTRRKIRRANARVDRRSMLDDHRKEEMLAVLIRNRRALEAVRSHLTPGHVGEISEGYALVWQVVARFYAARGAMPTRKQIEVGLHQALTDMPESGAQQELEEIDEFLDFAFDDGVHGRDISRSRTHREQAVETCKLFLQEVAAAEISDIIIQNGAVATDLPLMLERTIDEIRHAETMNAAAPSELFPAGWDTVPNLTTLITGVEPLDRLTGGGPAVGEVVVVMAPMGSCKTVVAVQLACNAATQAALLVESGGARKGKVPMAVLVSTEMDAQEFRIRALTYMARVPRRRLKQILESGAGLEALSRSPLPAATAETRYEKRWFRDGKAGYTPEYHRVLGAIRTLSEHLLFFNYSESNPDRPAANMPSVDAIRAWIVGVIKQRKNVYPISFVLDHASALAMQISAKVAGSSDKDATQLRAILRDIPRACGAMLAKPYGAPCIIMHQLSGEANSRNPTAKMHHTDAAECKSFAEFADFAIVCGQPTEDERRLCRWDATKHRREPPRGDLIVQIVGDYNYVRDASDEYVCETSARAFLRKDEVAGDAKKPASGRRYRDDGEVGG